MKKLIMATIFVSTTVSAQTIITPQGSYLVQQSGTTTYVTQTAGSSNQSNAIAVAVPVNVNPVTGIGSVQGPNGSYLIQRSGSTTTVIQTSKGK